MLSSNGPLPSVDLIVDVEEIDPDVIEEAVEEYLAEPPVVLLNLVRALPDDHFMEFARNFMDELPELVDFLTDNESEEEGSDAFSLAFGGEVVGDFVDEDGEVCCLS